MTTFSHTITLDDSERSTLSTALAMLKDDCLEQLETTPGAPYKARLRNIERIEKKLEEGARQTSGNAFGAGFGSTLNAVGIHRPVGRSAYVVLAEIPQPWRDQFQEALRGSACPVVEGAGPCAHAHDWQSWVRGEWYGRPGPR